MHINKLPTKTGYLWFKQGFWIFWQNPFIFLLNSLCFVFLMMPPLFAIGRLLSPLMQVGFMTLCRNTLNQKSASPVAQPTLSTTYNKKIVTRLLLFGLFDAIGSSIVILLTWFILIPLVPWPAFQTAPQKIMESKHWLLLSWTILTAVYAGVFTLNKNGFTPTLIAWHQIPLNEAVTISIRAYRRNFSAMLLNALLWLLLLIFAYVLVLFSYILVLLSFSTYFTNFNLLVPAICALAILVISIPIILCTHYINYMSCFSSGPIPPHPRNPD